MDPLVISEQQVPLKTPQQGTKVAGDTKALKKRKIRKKKYNLTINYRHCRYGVIRLAAKRCGWSGLDTCPMKSILDWDVYWTDTGSGIEHMIHISKPFQRVNHFPGMRSIYRKHNLSKSIATMKRLNSAEYSFFPKSWILPDDTLAIQKEIKYSLLGGNSTNTDNLPSSASPCFIVKPVAGSQVASVSSSTVVCVCCCPQAA